MHNTFLVLVAGAFLCMSLFIGFYSLFRSQSYKKNYYLILQAMVVIFLFGHLLELTSTNSEEAYTGIKVLYVGAYFAALFSFFFIADYCNVKLHLLFVKLPMAFFAAISVSAIPVNKKASSKAATVPVIHRIFFTRPSPFRARTKR